MKITFWQKYQVLIILIIVITIGFFSPLIGLFGVIIVFTLQNNKKLTFSKDEFIMFYILGGLLTLYYLLTVFYNRLYPAQEESQIESFLRLIFIK